MIKENLNSSIPININKVTKSDLIDYFTNSWLMTEYLFSSIKEIDSLYINPDPRRHPLIFYFGHVAAFYINKLRISGLYDKEINPTFENLFAVGVDPSTKDDLEKYGWPQYEKVVEFRTNIFDAVMEVLESVELPHKIDWDSPYWTIVMAIEHERIHFETSSVLIRQYTPELIRKPENWKYLIENEFIPETGFVNINGGEVKLGRPADSNMYGWDNEYGERTVIVDPFSVSKNLITNKEYLEFINDGGYNNSEYWSEAGWNWIKEQNLLFPKFWIKQDSSFKLRAMFDLIDMQWNWPVEVIAHEAEAFCKWKGEGYRLMTEAEWKCITDNYFETPNHDFHDVRDSNTNFRYGSTSPVGYFGEKAPYDIIGNVWEILADDFYQLSGFKEHPFYKDFSLPYFDNQHGMMAGGSWASTGNSASRYYRLWFRRDFVQHAGFRLVKQ
jgi:5-histidylcysteine sulfoxide synthase